MKLILVRHGETEENLKFIIQGHRHGTLSELGQTQIRQVAKKLSTEKLDIIYTSDLGRCVATAQAIHKYHPKIKLVLRTEIREFKFGFLEGFKYSRTKWGVKMGRFMPGSMLGIESPKSVRERVVPFINQIYEKHKNDTVLVVTHGGPIRIIKTAVEKLPLSSYMKLDVPNTSVWRFDVQEPIT